MASVPELLEQLHDDLECVLCLLIVISDMNSDEAEHAAGLIAEALGLPDMHE